MSSSSCSGLFCHTLSSCSLSILIFRNLDHFCARNNLMSFNACHTGCVLLKLDFNRSSAIQKSLDLASSSSDSMHSRRW